MRDGRNRLLLPRCCSAEKRACRNKENIVQASVLQLTQDFCTQYRCAAAAARTARMNVLRLSVKYHHPAIAVVRADINVLLQEKLSQIAAAYQSQITREYQIIISRLCLRIAKISRYGVRRSRCCCQGLSINLRNYFLFFRFTNDTHKNSHPYSGVLLTKCVFHSRIDIEKCIFYGANYIEKCDSHVIP